MTEVMVRVNGADLCADTVGDSAAPAVLLISGGAASMDLWDPLFCERIADGGRYVIRYDHRDTGRSTSYPPGAPAYSGDDLVADAAGLIDELGGGRAHVVGISMGGGMAQELALEHPGRVATLTLISTSPIGSDRELPPMTEGLAATFSDPLPDPDWTDREAVREYLVEIERPFAGPDSFDEPHVREMARRAAMRTVDPESMVKNHWLLGGDGAPPTTGSDQIDAPTLVVHGTHDPMFPGHGAELARQIDGAELLMLDGVGHQVPPRRTWGVVVAAILCHTGP